MEGFNNGSIQVSQSDIHIEVLTIRYIHTVESCTLAEMVQPSFFKEGQAKIIFSLIKKYITSKNTYPPNKAIEALVAKYNSAQKTKYSSIITSGFLEDCITPINDSDVDIYKDAVEGWIRVKSLEFSLNAIADLTIKERPSIDNIDDVTAKIKEIINEGTQVSFTTDLGYDFFDVNSYVRDISDIISTGDELMDEILDGGYEKKTLISYMGPPNAGKSIFLVNEAVRAVKSKKNVVYLSFEMSSLSVIERAYKCIFGRPTGFNIEDPVEKIKLQEELTKQKGNLGDFRVFQFPTGVANTRDIENYLINLEKSSGKIFDVVVIDYLNLMGPMSRKRSDNMYLKIKEIVESLRALAIRRNCVVITATQTNRGGKGKDGGAYNRNDYGMDDVSESASISHTVDVLWAIIQTNDDRKDNSYFLKLAKTRNSGGREKIIKFHIDYNTMRLSSDKIITEDNSIHDDGYSINNKSDGLRVSSYDDVLGKHFS